jgi:hypothetical protein
MHERETQVKAVEALRGLIDRLGAPDLTLTEASQLRCQVAQILGEAAWAGCEDKPACGTTGHPR